MITYKCHVCQDNHMVIDGTINDGIERYRPCEFCNTKAWERWQGGHFATNHFCADCEDIRRGRRGRRGDDE